MTALRIAIFAAVATSLVRFVLVWRGAPETTLIADDAFYYFTIARHLAQGYGPTFDTLAWTNGFHPLWLLLITPIFALNPNDLWTPVRVVLSFSVLLELAAGVLLYRAVARLHGTREASAAVLLWFVAPFTFYIGLRGMEASLSVLCLAALYSSLSTRERAGRFSARDAMVVGAWLALAGWARLDSLATAGGAVAVWLLVRSNALGLSHLAALERIAVVAATSAALVLPWFVWNIATFGDFAPVSGRVKDVIRLFGSLPWSFDSVGDALWSLFNAVLAPVLKPTRLLSDDGFRHGVWAIPLALSCGVGIAVLASLSLRRSLVGATFPLAYLLLHVGLYGFIGHLYMSWYAPPFFAFAFVLVAPALVRRDDSTSVAGLGGTTRGIRAVGLASLIAALCAGHLLAPLKLRFGARGFEKKFGERLQQASDATTERAAIGMFDAGAAGYVATAYPDVYVVNLDGLVNNEAFGAYRDGRYADYVRHTITFAFQDMGRARQFVRAGEVDALRRHFGQPDPRRNRSR